MLKKIVEEEFPTIEAVLDQVPPADYTGSGVYAMVAALRVRSVTLSPQKNSCMLYIYKSHQNLQ